MEITSSVRGATLNCVQFDFSIASQDNWKIECFPTTTTHTKLLLYFTFFRNTFCFTDNRRLDKTFRE